MVFEVENTDVKNDGGLMSASDSLESMVNGNIKENLEIDLGNEEDIRGKNNFGIDFESGEMNFGDVLDLDIKKNKDFRLKYLDMNTNLEFRDELLFDENAPFEAVKNLGDGIKKKSEFDEYMKEVEKFGEDIARYKWAFDEGRFGEFNGGKFAKEVFKAGVRGIGANNLFMAGNMFKIMGGNLRDKKIGGGVATMGASLLLPDAGKVFDDIGDAINNWAEKVENLEILKADDSAYSNEPNWMSLANILGQGGANVLAMGGASKLIGSRATYGLFALGGSGEVWNESMDKDENVDKANMLTLASAGSSYAIDRIFNPLPNIIEKGVKKTSKEIAKEMLEAPIRELGSEIFQQVFSENLVRKIGIDETQLLFEGMIESAIGAMAGNMVVSGVDGSVYFANKSLDEVKRRILLKGVSDDELKLFESNMLEFMKSNPKAFDKILGYNIKQNINEILRGAETGRERAKAKEEVSHLPKIYDKMYNKLLEATEDESRARAGARMFEANALFFKQLGVEPRYLELVEGYLPEVKKQSFSEFLKTGSVFNNRFQFGGLGAKNVDYDKVGEFLKLEEEKVDPQLIWQKTGMIRGNDGKIRFEISDENAKIKLWNDAEYEKRSAIYEAEVMHDLELLRMQLAYSLLLKKGGKLNSVFSDFYDYLKKNDEDEIKLSNRGKAGIYDPYLERGDFSYVIDEAVDLRRKYEEIVLSSIVEDYQDGERDFSEKKGLVVEGIKEKKRFQEFYKKYWSDISKPAKQQLYEKIITEPNQWTLSEEFVERMNDIEKKFEEKRNKRLEAVDKKGIVAKGFFFRDIELEESYLIERAMNKDVNDDRADMNYRDYDYKKAYLPHTNAEKFLETVEYDFFDDIPRNVLSSYLDKVEQYYKLEKYINEIKNNDKETNIKANRSLKHQIMLQKKPRDTDVARLNISNGKKMKLDDVLKHDELFKNYPELKDSVVSFVKLNDDEPYHFYFDKEKGYVFEFDADQLDKTAFTELLIKGTSFAVQHKEGFDYTLNEKQRKNYMDRSVYIAKKAIEKDTKEKMTTMLLRLNIIDNPRDANKFWKVNMMPVSLLNIYNSESINSAEGGAKSEVIKYGEVDFDAILEEFKVKFPKSDDLDEEYIRKVAYMNLHSFKEKIMKQVMFLARVESGYYGSGLPWGGIVSQGRIDERAMFNHRIKRGYLPKDKFLSSSHGEYSQDDFAFASQGDVMVNVKDEIDMYENDEKAFKFINKEAANGAYDFQNNVISLFENADSKTIVHESFHYFYNFLKNSVGKNNLAVSSVFEVMNDIKAQYVKNYDIMEYNGLYYATYKGSNEVISDKPIGYRSKEELLEAVGEEILIERFIRVINGQPFVSVEFKETDKAEWSKKGSKVDDYYANPNSKVKIDRTEIMDVLGLYSKWLKSVCGASGVNMRKSGKGGKKIFQSLFNKKK